MKFIKFYFLVMSAFSLLIAIYFPFQETTAAPSKEVIKLSTSPTSSFINFENMAPGDKKSEILSVKNKGNINFNYFISAERADGDKDLFDHLKLIISEGSKTYYNGELKGLNNLEIGSLLSLSDDNLLFTFELPLKSGNEVKRKSTSVAFNFVANNNLDNNRIGKKLPKTGTNNFNTLVAGGTIILIGFIGQYIVIIRRRIKKV